MDEPWKILYTKDALKDKRKAYKAGFQDKIERLLSLLKENPYTPPYEKLVGNFSGAYSRRINIQHRLVYSVHETEKVVKIISMWHHYE
ncbi:MAG TPA: Txe/YoeB family addiction module toxin [Methylomusa anaerophila]|uniref:Endoribonuclease YoeB n=1 Tax=Methylomusa anaerophila TaxID=1930071 RepID=A0A348AK35_9FIRM|nr:Txe/YoeB family addiction module toxin [Methylomusa anaerophila]BBB91433.1 plasmid encoded toxin Txe [Methylomusa anaerophila]HML90144.1 Txe/YoeB family addiction module toxin [Methylomusa anaerophila]